MNTTLTMEPTQETSALLTTLAEWWKQIAAVAGGIGGFLAFLRARKIKISKVLKAVYGWIRAAVLLPVTLGEIQTQLQMKDGRGFSVWAEGVDQTLIGVRQALALETSHRRASMQNAQRAIFEAGADGRFLWVNTEFETEADCLLREVQGNSWRNIVAIPDREAFYDSWQEAVKDGTNFKGRFRLNVESGPDRWMLFDATCNKDEFGQVLGYLGYMRPTADPRAIHATHDTE